MHAPDHVRQARELAYVIGRSHGRLHLWKSAAWRSACRGFPGTPDFILRFAFSVWRGDEACTTLGPCREPWCLGPKWKESALLCAEELALRAPGAPEWHSDLWGRALAPSPGARAGWGWCPSHTWPRARHRWPHVLPGQWEVWGAGRRVGQDGSRQLSVGLTAPPASASA